MAINSRRLQPRSHRNALVAFIGMLVFGSLAAIGDADRSNAMRSSLSSTQVEASTSRDLTEQFPRRSMPAVVRPGRDVTLAAPLDGRLARILVEEGDTVERGDTIAQMDDRVAQAAVARARVEAAATAGVTRARCELELAQRQLSRLEASAARNAATVSELDEARTAVARTEAALDEATERVNIAKARLSLEEARLEEHAIRAPFDGVVVRIDAEDGAALNLAEPILRIVTLDHLEADLHLPAELIGATRPGQPITLVANRPFDTTRLRATVAAAEPIIDAGSDTFRCRVRIDNPEATLPAGFIVRIDDAQRRALASLAAMQRAAKQGAERVEAGVDTD